MKTLLKNGGLWIAAAMLSSTALMAQDKVETSIGTDLVSGYIWRGQDLGNVSIQPALGIAYKGFSLSAWGSVGFAESDTKEFDLTLGYGIKGFSVSVTDYWFSGGPGYFHYKSQNTMHTFEAQIGYDFGFLSVNWYTNFAGNVGYTQDGDKAYASYINLEAPFRLGGLDWVANVGATPWGNDFYNGGKNSFAVSEIGLKATKVFKITSRWELPLFARVIWNPATEGAYFVAGLSLL